MDAVMKSTAIREKKEQREIRKKNRMEKRRILGLPIYGVGEEIFSAVSHGISALLAVFGLIFLLSNGRRSGIVLAATAVYGGTMILLYTVSTLYHALGVTKAKKVFRVLDHCTIFLLIAGTYTPITLLCIRGRLGFTMFCVVWAAAVIGVVLNAIDLKRFSKLSMVCYLCMGWVVIVAMKPLVASINTAGLWALFIGGAFYTVGAVLYGVGKKVRYMHCVWHLFVLAGSVAHTVCIYQIIL